MTSTFFSLDDGDKAVASSICRSCPHAAPCREGAWHRQERFGIWGGVDFNRGLRGRPPVRCPSCAARVAGDEGMCAECLGEQAAAEAPAARAAALSEGELARRRALKAARQRRWRRQASGGAQCATAEEAVAALAASGGAVVHVRLGVPAVG